MSEAALCPKCLGQGRVSIPPNHPADRPWTQIQAGMTYICDLCQGEKVILSRFQTDREKRLEDALHRIYDCLESDIRALARNKTLCFHLGVYKKAVKRALLAEQENKP